MGIQVITLNKKGERLKKIVLFIAEKSLVYLKKEEIYLEIYLADEFLMKEINQKFRHQDKRAKVLSFIETKNFHHPETKNKVLGEIYLNSDYFSKTGQPKKELVFFLVHGLLHLLGYEHFKKRDRIKMERLNEKICQDVLYCH